MSGRRLTQTEVDEVIESVLFDDDASAYFEEDIRRRLAEITVREDGLDVVKTVLRRRLRHIRAKPNLHVGVAAGQCLGQPITQMALSSFKKTGTTEFDSLDSMAQIRGILRWKKDAKDAQCVAYVNPDAPSDIVSLRRYARSLQAVRVKDLLVSMRMNGDVLNLTFDNSKRYVARINMRRIANAVTSTTHMPTAVASEVFGTLAVRTRRTSSASEQNRSEILARGLNMPSSSAPQQSTLAISKDVYRSITNVKISGLDDVSSVIVTSDGLHVTGPVFARVLSYSFVDAARSRSHSIWEVYKTLGIEATRAMIVERIHDLSGLDHLFRDKSVCLLADQMCSRGYPLQANKNGLERTNAGFLRSVSFENGIYTLRKTVIPVRDPIEDPSAKVITGKRLF